MASSENLSPVKQESFPDPEGIVGDSQVNIEKNWADAGKEEKYFRWTVGGSVLFHISVIVLMIFSPSFRDLVGSFLGIRLPVLSGEKIFLSVLDPSQVQFGKETQAPLLQKGYSINGQPDEQGHQNVLSNPVKSPPTNRATVPSRSPVVSRPRSNLHPSRAILLNRSRRSPRQIPQLQTGKQILAPKKTTGSLAPGRISQLQEKMVFQKAQKSSSNRTPHRSSRLKHRSLHIPNDEFPNQANSPNTEKPSFRHPADRTASLVRTPVVPMKQIQTKKLTTAAVAKNDHRTMLHRVRSSHRGEIRKGSLPLPLVVNAIQPRSQTSRPNVPMEKKKTVPQNRTITRENRSLEQASLGDMKNHVSLQISVNPVYEMRSDSSGRTIVKEEDVLYSKYIKDIDRKFEQVGKFPHHDANNKITGENRIAFTIRKDGTLSDLRIVKSSDHSSLDEESLRIVQDSAPFHPLPALLKKNALTLIWTFHYSGGGVVPVSH